ATLSRAVSMRIGVEISRARSSRQTVSPSLPGRSQSSTITSYSVVAACSSPSVALKATSTTNPSSWSPLTRSLAALRSSSISRTRMGRPPSERHEVQLEDAIDEPEQSEQQDRQGPDADQPLLT